MDIWSFTKEGYNSEDTVLNGNRFLIANGYMGYRGTLDEWGRDEMAAVNIAGFYDRFEDKWREPINAPNGLYARLTVNGETQALGVGSTKIALSEDCPLHTQTINFKNGLHTRETSFPQAVLKSERFASMANPHLLVSRLTIKAKSDGNAELLTGIVTDIWDINGPHLFGHQFKKGEILQVHAETGELKLYVSVTQGIQAGFEHTDTQEITDTGIYRKLAFDVNEGQSYTLTIYSCVTITRQEPAQPADTVSLMNKALKHDFVHHFAAHEKKWEELWENSYVQLEGNDEAARALNASLYHLHSIAPRHADNLSIPARGLSGQTYKGAIFWDSELFMLPVFTLTEPELARSMLRYRIETLPGALEKAKEYGYRGAFYPWESQEGGIEGCSDYNVVDVFTHRPVRTYFRDKQIHISGIISYAIRRFADIDGDIMLLKDGGAEVILQCARFYLSRMHMRVDTDEVELLDVVGPDEYHERVNNNAFTNRIAAHSLENVLYLEKLLKIADPVFWAQLINRLGFSEDLRLIRKIYPKFNRTFGSGELIEQFDGYFRLEDCRPDDVRARLLDKREYWGTNHGVASQTQVLKQADVIAMIALFPELFSDAAALCNFEYYEPRTEHGSSLSSCMYALVACRIGKPDLAWKHFMKAASIDLVGGGKHWAGEIYIGGTHPAANGSAWIIAVHGFAGLTVENGEITLKPNMPQQITSLRFPVTHRGERLMITVTHDGWDIKGE